MTEDELRTEREKLLGAFCLQNLDRINEWHKAHGKNAPPPIIFDETTNKLFWANRAQRRQKGKRNGRLDQGSRKKAWSTPPGNGSSKGPKDSSKQASKGSKSRGQTGRESQAG